MGVEENSERNFPRFHGEEGQSPRERDMEASASSCCPSDRCGVPEEVSEDLPSSRYSAHPPPNIARPDPSLWAVAPAPAEAQFLEKIEGQEEQEEQEQQTQQEHLPWHYSEEHLAAVAFPLGGLGSGNAFLLGDGSLGGWTVVNQVRAEKLPMHCMPGCFFGVSACTGGAEASEQSYALLTPQNYTLSNVCLPVHCPAHVSDGSVQRLRKIPGIRAVTMSGTFPIADVTYDIPGFPAKISMEAITSIIPTETFDSALPSCMFRFTASNITRETVTLRVLQAQQNFIGWNGEENCCSKTDSLPFWGGNVNKIESDSAFSGLVMSSESLDVASDEFAGTLAVGGVEGEDSGSTLSYLLHADTEEELWDQFLHKNDRRTPDKGRQIQEKNEFKKRKRKIRMISLIRCSFMSA